MDKIWCVGTLRCVLMRLGLCYVVYSSCFRCYLFCGSWDLFSGGELVLVNASIHFWVGLLGLGASFTGLELVRIVVVASILGGVCLWFFRSRVYFEGGWLRCWWVSRFRCCRVGVLVYVLFVSWVCSSYYLL